MWRSQEMRIIAQSMASVAMRLAEPEEIAHDSIVTVGQAIRREVAAMGDGVERALARAAELEALVANEVSALERAYNDNEVRIRGLLETLGHQRDNPGRPGRTGAQRHQRRASRSVPGHRRRQRQRGRSRPRKLDEDCSGSKRQGRTHHDGLGAGPAIP